MDGVTTAPAEPTTSTASSRRTVRYGYVAGLDGIRGAAVFAVLIYHNGFEWAKGFFFSVPTFFTLSGFLIATLVIEEIRGSGTLDFRNFWSRRARRLLPAATVTLAAILIFHRAFGNIPAPRLRGDVFAALGYVENWWLIHTNQPYNEVFGASSPVQHFWTLAIEEQYYLFFPIACFFFYKVFRKTNIVAIVFALLGLASLIAGAIVGTHGDVTAAYYATYVRASEIIAGVVLAFIMVNRTVGATPRARRRVDIAGLTAIGVTAVLWFGVTLHSWFVFRGGTFVNSVATCTVIVACLQPGIVSRLMSWRPLSWLGRMSYGVYLIHWPVFLWLNEGRVHTSATMLFLIRFGVTLVISVALYRFIEHPVRRGQFFPTMWFAGAALGMVIVIVGGSLLLTQRSTLAVDLANAAPVDAQLHTLRADQAPPGQKRVLVVGDSLAWTVEIGLKSWGAAHNVDVQQFTAVGCGIGGAGELRYLGIVGPTLPDCGPWHDKMAAAVAAFHPDVVLVVVGLADLSPRKFGNQFLSIGDQTFDQRLHDRIVTMATELGSSGGRVVWATYPHVKVPYNPGGTGKPPFVENQPVRADELNTIVTSALPSVSHTSMVDFAAFCRRQPGGEFNPKFRPDGVHLGLDSSKQVATWLGPQLLKTT